MRRSLYLYALAQGRAVSRDEAAAAVGIRRGLAAFHLDRLADDGMVEVEFRRLTGRTGPGAGRPSKLYRVGGRQHEISLPPRAYALAAELLAEALESLRPGGAGASAEEIAEKRGHDAGQAARAGLGSRPSVVARQAALAGVLAEHGYQPAAAEGATRLRNCPFHALAGSHRELVCGMNAAYLCGVLDGLGLQRLEARLEPTEGECCVVVSPAKRVEQ